MNKIAFEVGARVEIDKVFEWYYSRSVDAAERFLQQIDATAQRVRKAPLQFPVSRFGCRAAVIDVFPYVLYFTIGVDTITIVAVAHAKQMPGYFVGRRSSKDLPKT
jgi:plasmid stabilization system protein ParE